MSVVSGVFVLSVVYVVFVVLLFLSFLSFLSFLLFLDCFTVENSCDILLQTSRSRHPVSGIRARVY